MNPDELAHSIALAAGSYAIAAGILTLLPGPDTAVVVATALSDGPRAAVRAAFGIAVGLLLWAVAAGLGVAALLRASSELYTVFRFACVAFLLWLAVGALRAAFARGRSAGDVPEPNRRMRRLPWGFRQALLTAGLNPKLGVFFVVFLPQFIPAGTSTMGMSLLFGGIQAVEALLWYLLLGSVAARARTVLNRPRVRRALHAVTGAVFAFFGARLAFDL